MAGDEQKPAEGAVSDEPVDLGEATAAGDEVVRYDPEERDSKARQNIAYWLLGILSIGLGVPLLAWIFGKTATEVVDVSTKLLAPIVGLLGTVLGFYFASRKK